MSTIHVHIGGAKTGTTMVQSVFKRSRDVLAKNGFWYPLAAGVRGHGRFYCAMEVDRDTPRHRAQGLTTSDARRAFSTQLRADFDKERKKHAKADYIVSSEHFFTFSSEAIEAMRAFFAARFDAIRVYYYFRNPVDFEISMYSTRMKSGKIRHFMNKPAFNPDNRHLRLQEWEAAFGADNVEVVFFDRKTLKNASIVDDLFSRIGLDPGVAVLAKARRNEVLDLATLEVLRHMNAGIFEKLGYDVTARRKFVKELEARSSGQKPTILPETAARIHDDYREAIAYFADRSGTPVEDVLRTSRVSTGGPTLESYELTLDDALQVLGRLGLEVIQTRAVA